MDYRCALYCTVGAYLSAHPECAIQHVVRQALIPFGCGKCANSLLFLIAALEVDAGSTAGVYAWTVYHAS
jgi:hypothetical protein